VGVLHPPTGRPDGEFSRRSLLAGGGRGLLALALLGTTAAACGSTPSGPDPLEEQLAGARRDSDLAAAAAKAAPAAVVPALAEIAAERARHATALIEELARAAGKPIPTETSDASSPTPSASAAAAPPAPPPSVAEVADALRRSADSAAALVPTLSGYRAGLLGSIAAACTTSYEVGLPRRRPK
jgi:hypothetical protein